MSLQNPSSICSSAVSRCERLGRIRQWRFQRMDGRTCTVIRLFSRFYAVLEAVPFQRRQWPTTFLVQFPVLLRGPWLTDVSLVAKTVFEKVSIPPTDECVEISDIQELRCEVCTSETVQVIIDGVRPDSGTLVRCRCCGSQDCSWFGKQSRA